MNRLRLRKENWGYLSWSQINGLDFHKNIGNEIVLNAPLGVVRTVETTIAHRSDSLPRKISTLSGPLVVGYQITNYCNLQCSYCFAEPAFMRHSVQSPIDIMQLVDRIALLQPLTVWISGGEPTLAEDLPSVLNRFSAHQIPVTLDTNGTFVSDEIIESIRSSYHVQIRISLDASKAALQNELRGLAERTFRGLSEFLDSGLSIAIHTVLTEVSVPHLRTLYNMLIRKGIKKWILFDVVAAGWALGHYSQIPKFRAEVEDVFEVNEQNGRPLSIVHVKGNSPRCMVLIDQIGTLYTQNGRYRLASGNLLKMTAMEAWKNLQIDRHAHLAKYVNSRVG